MIVSTTVHDGRYIIYILAVQYVNVHDLYDLYNLYDPYVLHDLYGIQILDPYDLDNICDKRND